MCALAGDIRNHTVNSDACKHERQRSENSEQNHGEAMRGERACDDGVHGFRRYKAALLLNSRKASRTAPANALGEPCVRIT